MLVNFRVENFKSFKELTELSMEATKLKILENTHTFTQKNILGQSELYSLIEYGKGKVKDNFKLEKNYLEGKFGATPYIHSLISEINDG